MASTSDTDSSTASPSGQGTSRTRAADPEVRSLISEVAVANQSAEAQHEQANTNTPSSAQQLDEETAEKLNKMLTQNQSSEVESKGQLREVSNQKESTKSSVQTDFAQKQNSQTSSKSNQSANSSQSKQTNQPYQILVM